MLDGIQNGNDEKPEENRPPEAPAEAEGADKERLNQAFIKDGVMIVNIYLEDSKSAFATAIGSLDLAKDLVKNYFARKSMAEAAAKARATQRIIIPKLS